MHAASHRRKLGVYHSPWHLIGTFGLLALPLGFLLVFSATTKIAIPELLADVLVSSWRMLAAYTIAAVLAWLLAVSFFRGRRATVALPLFDVLQSFPTFALLPLAVLTWGPSSTTVILFLIFTIVWPMFFTILASLRAARRDWDEAVSIAGLSGWDYIRLYLFPVSLPGLITGSIIGIGEGWEALVATEIIVRTQNGLGEFFQTFATNPRVTALGIFGFLLLIFTINKLLWLPLLEWSHHETEE